ncbi:MAG: hypothetical protein Q4F34_05445 [Prevotellaceae bacterium]|nr:hypothetical protein [Prevotellaceae bacterium]
MKKTYLTPSIKAIEVRHANMLCASPELEKRSLFKGEIVITDEINDYSDKEGYGMAW